MNQRRWCCHLLAERRRARKQLLGCAIIGANKRWTSFVPLGTPAPPAIDGVVAAVFYDADSALTVRIGERELRLALEGSRRLPAKEQQLVATWVREQVLTAAGAKALKAGLTQPAWLRARGVEKAFGFPQVTPLPAPCLVGQLPEGADVVNVAAIPKSSTAAKPQAGTLSPAQQQRVREYERELVRAWDEDDFKPYHLLKQHLSAARRHELDEWIFLWQTYESDEVLARRLDAMFADVYAAAPPEEVDAWLRSVTGSTG